MGYTNSGCAVIIGGSSGIGRSLVQELSVRGTKLIIISRGEKDLKFISSDTNIRNGTLCYYKSIDLSLPDLDIKSILLFCCSVFPKIDYLFITAGIIDKNDDGISDENINYLVNTNYLNIIRIIGLFSRYFENNGLGQIIVLSSIAAHAPRKSNIIYSSAKSGLEIYCKGLQHRYAFTNIRIKIIILGYVNTPMNFGKTLLFPKANPSSVAKFLIKSLNKNFRIKFYPCFWRWIIYLLKSTPWIVYKRLNY